MHELQTKSWNERRRKKELGTRSSLTSVCHHVERRAEFGRLFEAPCEVAIESIEEARNAIQKCTSSWMQWHKVQRCKRKNTSSVAWLESLSIAQNTSRGLTDRLCLARKEIYSRLTYVSCLVQTPQLFFLCPLKLVPRRRTYDLVSFLITP